MSRNIQNSFIYTVATTQPANIATASDVNLSNIQNNQILRYDTSTGDFVNTSDVISIFGRNGIVTAQNNDYDITQINNSSVLANSNNINIASPNLYQYLSYDNTTSKWINKDPYFSSVVQQVSSTITAQFGYIYLSSSAHITIPSGVGFSDQGKIITIIGNAILSFDSLLTLNDNIFGPFSLATGSGVLILMCTGTNLYNIVSNNTYANNINTGKAFDVKQLQDLINVNISTPLTNQLLTYDGSNWINQNPPSYVTSVGLTTTNSLFNITNTPITTNGNINIDFNNSVAQNLVLASPNGSSGTISARALVANDLPTIPTNKLQSASFTLTATNGFWSATPVSLGGGANLTLNNASVGVAGIVSTTAQAFSGLKTMNDGIKPVTIYDNGNASGTVNQYIKSNGAGGIVWTQPQLNSLSDINLGTLNNYDVLKYNSSTSNWVNTYSSFSQYFSSAGNLTNNNYIRTNGQSGQLDGSEILIGRTRILYTLTTKLNKSLTSGSRTFTIILNGSNSGYAITYTSASPQVQTLTINLTLNSGDELAIFHTATSPSPNSSGYCTLELI